MAFLIKILSPYLAKYKWGIAFSLSLSLVMASVKFAQVSLLKPLFDEGLVPGAPMSKTLSYAGYLLFFTLLHFPLKFTHFYILRKAIEQAAFDLRAKYFAKVQDLEVSELEKRAEGELTSRLVNDVKALTSGLHGLVELVREPAVAVAMLGLALYRDWQLTLVVLAMAPILAFIFNFVGKKVQKYQKYVQESMGEMTQKIDEGLQGQKISRVFGVQKYFVQRFLDSQQKYVTYSLKSIKAQELASPMVQFIVTMAFCGVLYFAHKRITAQQLEVGEFLSFVAALALFNEAIRKFSKSFIKLKQAQAAGERIVGFDDFVTEKDGGALDYTGLKESIEFKNITFSYGDEAVLKNINLVIPKGSKVALVGQSGSGKSTLINLLLRFYELQEGSILIDGRPMQNYKLPQLRSKMNYVGQNVFLIHDTIKENILVGRKEDLAKLQSQLELTNLAQVIDQSPKKELAVIGDEGSKLSGGQKQRLALARSLYDLNDVILLDEATSALDNESERTFQDRFDQIGRDKTVLAVAHRLSTVEKYDLIVVMKDGEIVECGSHVSLLERNGEYKKLIQMASQ